MTSRSSPTSDAAEATEIVLEVEDVEVVPHAGRRRAPPPPPAAALSAPPAAGRRSQLVPTGATAGNEPESAPAESAPRPRRKSHSTWPGVQPPVIPAEQPALKRPGAPEEMEPLNSSPNADLRKRVTAPVRHVAPEPGASAGSPSASKLESIPVYLQLEAELDRAQYEMDRLARQMRARDAYLLELERALADSQAQLHSLGVDNAASAAQLAGRLRGQAFRIAELEDELQRREQGMLEPERHTEIRPRATSNRKRAG